MKISMAIKQLVEILETKGNVELEVEMLYDMVGETPVVYSTMLGLLKAYDNDELGDVNVAGCPADRLSSEDDRDELKKLEIELCSYQNCEECWFSSMDMIREDYMLKKDKVD